MIAVNLLQMTVWFVGHCDHGQSRPGADGHRHRPALGSSRSDREGSPRFRINYWVKNKLSDRDIKRTDEVIEATKKSKGLLPKDVVRTGFSPAPTKDFIDGNYCDEGHSGPGLFDDPDDPDDPQHQNVNATISEPRPCLPASRSSSVGPEGRFLFLRPKVFFTLPLILPFLLILVLLMVNKTIFRTKCSDVSYFHPYQINYHKYNRMVSCVFNLKQDCLLQGQAQMDQRVVFRFSTLRLRQKKQYP